MAARVLVTRPEPEASATAARLGRIGYRPLVLPLTEIVAVPLDDAPLPGSYDAVALTSVNAVRHAPPALIAALAGLDCYAVGERTAGAARAAGLSVRITGDGDAAALAGSIAAHVPAGSRIVHLAGTVRGDGLARRLIAAGIACEAIATYEARVVEHSAAALDAVARGGIDAALVYSPRAGTLLAALAENPAMARALGRARLLCLSDAVAATCEGLSVAATVVASAPREAALIAALENDLPPA